MVDSPGVELLATTGVRHMLKREFFGKAARSPKAQAVLDDRHAARELFAAIKSLRPGQPQFVSVGGVRFRSDARLPKSPAND